MKVHLQETDIRNLKDSEKCDGCTDMFQKWQHHYFKVTPLIKL
jgi:hypothetical protein